MSGACTPPSALRHAVLTGNGVQYERICVAGQPCLTTCAIRTGARRPPQRWTAPPSPLPQPQANALLRKNGVQQRRAWVQNLVAICMPIFFCLLLWGLQKVINNGAPSS